MLETRYESYEDGLPFRLNYDIIRTPQNQSKASNWHEELEIQLCLDGNGWVLMDGKKYKVNEGDVVVVGSEVIHYTGSEEQIKYSCLIINYEFCKNLEIDFKNIEFSLIIHSEKLSRLISKMQEIYLDDNYPCKTAVLCRTLIDILVELATNHVDNQSEEIRKSPKSYAIVRNAIRYVRENYAQKITLSSMAKELLTNKFSLSREFRNLTGQTVVEYINRYRILKAVSCLENGYSVSKTATECGFDNFSFFTKTFKKYVGKKPSELRTPKKEKS